MKKLTKNEMLEEIIIARTKKMVRVDCEKAYKRVEQLTLDYVSKVYDLFLTDKEHVEFYYALLVR